jgi:hypothetical protein
VARRGGRAMGGSGQWSGDEQAMAVVKLGVATAAVQKQKLRVRPTLLGAWGSLRRRVQNLTFVGYPRYIHRLTDEYTSLRSSMPGIFLDFGTEEYSSIIFLVTEEHKKTKEDTLFSCSVPTIYI